MMLEQKYESPQPRQLLTVVVQQTSHPLVPWTHGSIIVNALIPGEAAFFKTNYAITLFYEDCIILRQLIYQLPQNVSGFILPILIFTCYKTAYCAFMIVSFLVYQHIEQSEHTCFASLSERSEHRSENFARFFKSCLLLPNSSP